MRAAVCIYDWFCNFEISAILETMHFANIKVDFMSKTTEPVRCEEGMLAIPEKTWKDAKAEDYDILILTGIGAEDDSADWVITDEDLLNLIRDFDAQKKWIAAISVAPMILMSAGIIKDRPFVASVTKENFMENGGCTTISFTAEQLKNMIDVNEIDQHEGLDVMISDHIITANAWHYREWACEISKVLGIDFPYGTFGLAKR